MHVHPLEKRWAWIAAGLVAVMIAMVVYTAVAMSIHPPSHVEAIDSTRLHLTKEFAEDNLGVKREGDTVVARIVMARYHVEPPEITLPAGTPIVLRAASADVLHGLHVAGTNIGTQVVPGYVSELPLRFAQPGEHLMPCQEFCSVGHEGMWGKVKVIDKAEFASRARNGGRLSCVGQ